MIAIGELTSGNCTNERALALELDMSCGPIQVAYRTFEQTSLLQRKRVAAPHR
jgi:hypothetical protein